MRFPLLTIPHPWAWRKRTPGELPKILQGKLAYTETEILGGQIHQAVMYEPILTTLGGLVAFLLLVPRVPSGATVLGDILVLAFIALIVRLVWKWLEWTRSLFFFTSHRIIYIHGILTTSINMLPMSKVTDMRYDRTPAGQLLNYGLFIIESAGQVQALREMNYVPEPDATYKQVVDWLFGKGTTNVNLIDVNMLAPNKSVPVSVRQLPPGSATPSAGGAGSGIPSTGDTSTQPLPWWRNPG